MQQVLLQAVAAEGDADPESSFGLLAAALAATPARAVSAWAPAVPVLKQAAERSENEGNLGERLNGMAAWIGAQSS